MSFDEDAWWGNCANTFHEEEKQLVYASRMGLLASWHGAHPPTFDLQGRSVLDVGGGPTSLLLKCVNFRDAAVADPGFYPEWVLQRYIAHGVGYRRTCIEDGGVRPIDENFWDEAWCYNVLQHVKDPAEAVRVMRSVAKTVRLFEWIGIDPYPGHPNRLDREALDEWLGAPGFTAHVNENGAVGDAYYGVFRGI